MARLPREADVVGKINLLNAKTRTLYRTIAGRRLIVKTVIRFAIVLGIVFTPAAVFAQQEEKITLSTYYPAPYGEYESLSVDDPTTTGTGNDFTTATPGQFVVEKNVGIATMPVADRTLVAKGPVQINALADTGDTPYMFFNDSTGANTEIKFDMSYGAAQADPDYFRMRAVEGANAYEVLKINTSSGRVAIGPGSDNLTNPLSHILDVNGNIRVVGRMYSDTIDTDIPDDPNTPEDESTQEVIIKKRPRIFFTDSQDNTWGGIGMCGRTSNAYTYLGLWTQGGWGLKVHRTSADVFLPHASGGSYEYLLGLSASDKIVKFKPETMKTGTQPDKVLGLDDSGNLIKIPNDYYELSGSSLRYKRDIKDLVVDPENVLKLSPVSFVWKESGKADIGLIAEDVDGTIKDLATYDAEGKPDGVKYNKVPLYLLELAKKQQAEIAGQRNEIKELQAKAQEQQAQIDELVKQVKSLQDKK